MVMLQWGSEGIATKNKTGDVHTRPGPVGPVKPQRWEGRANRLVLQGHLLQQVLEFWIQDSGSVSAGDFI